jgi:hypothetical protein
MEKGEEESSREVNFSQRNPFISDNEGTLDTLGREAKVSQKTEPSSLEGVLVSCLVLKDLHFFYPPVG